MFTESGHAVPVTLAVTAGLGCGILIGALLASRRRGGSSGPPSTAVSVRVHW